MWKRIRAICRYDLFRFRYGFRFGNAITPKLKKLWSWWEQASLRRITPTDLSTTNWLWADLKSLLSCFLFRMLSATIWRRSTSPSTARTTPVRLPMREKLWTLTRRSNSCVPRFAQSARVTIDVPEPLWVVNEKNVTEENIDLQG